MSFSSRTTSATFGILNRCLLSFGAPEKDLTTLRVCSGSSKTKDSQALTEEGLGISVGAARLGLEYLKAALS